MIARLLAALLPIGPIRLTTNRAYLGVWRNGTTTFYPDGRRVDVAQFDGWHAQVWPWPEELR